MPDGRSRCLRHAATAMLAVLGIAACSDEPTAPDEVAAVVIQPASPTVSIGQTLQLMATVTDASGGVLTGQQVVWASTDQQKARVSSTGVLTGVASGTATISASSGGRIGITMVTITASPGAPTGQVVATGTNHSCALASSGRAYCWGSNADGQLGNNSNAQSRTPVAVAGDLTFRAIASSTLSDHTCAISTAGPTYCWGDNQLGQVGDASIDGFSRVPAEVVGGLAFTKVSAGASHSCALTTAGVAYCWGANNYGQLGNGSIVGRSAPVRVSTNLSFTAISAGHTTTCAVATDGAAYCWGSNFYGELGNGNTGTASAVPVRVTGTQVYTAIAAGSSHTCALASDGSAHCWGGDNNNRGLLGNGTTSNSAAAVAVSGGHSYTALAAGSSHTCGISIAGATYCWGWGIALGNGDTGDRTSPTLVAGGLTFAAVSGAFAHSCARATSGATYCWGSNFSGQLGNGSTELAITTPVAVTGLAP